MHLEAVVRSNPVIWVVNPYDATPGEGFKLNRYPRLAQALASEGADCTWITSSFLHYEFRQRDRNAISREVLPYKIEFVETPGYPPGISLARLKFLRGFASGLKKWAYEPGRTPPDIIVGSTPPIECLIACAEISKHFSATFIADVRDPWPDTFTSLSPWILKPAAWVFARLSDRKLRTGLVSANAMMSVSSTFLNWATEKRGNPTEKTVVVPLTTDIRVSDEIIENRVKNSLFIVTYVGTLGLSFDWTTLKHALLLSDLQKNGISVNIIGTGRGSKKIVSDIDNSELLRRHVTYLGAVPYSQVMEVLLRSTVSIAPHTPGSTASLTNKFFDFMAAGLPIINSLRGEPAEIIKTNNVGLNYEAGNSAALADCLINLCRNRDLVFEYSRNMSVLAQQYSPSNVFGKAAEFILSV